ncbi:penicillin acylase family protein [Escherichia coli]|nr:penicillin acylase family protein [Escherichia coli]
MKNRNRMIVNCVTASLMCCWSLPALAEQSSSEIKIVRDEYGMPHIYANDTWHLFYGYGYVVAQDRLFQMEMARRSTQGTVAEVLGKDFVKFDKDIRRNYWPDAIRAQIAALSPEDMSILQGYADGMNAWIDKVNTNPETLLPKQFNTFGFTPKRWEPFDVAMIFVGTMANRFSDSTSEIDNLALLTALKDKYGVSQGMAVFNQLKWLVNPSAPTTIAVQESSYPLKFNQQNSQTAALLPRYDLPAPMLDRPAKGADGALLALTAGKNRETIAAQFAQGGANGLAGYPTTSNMWVIGKSKAQDAKAIMVNGPQFGWYAPAYTYGIGLHGAGYDVTGNTPFAYPGLVFGHNGVISWGSTAGFGDDVDIFAERLSAEKPGYYLHNGKWVKMLSREETITVKNGQAETFTVWRTVHGNILQTDQTTQTAYAKSRAWDGKEVASLLAWTHQMKAKNWQEWTQQAAKQALTINWYYADVNGNIGYVHTGAYPDRQSGHDPRLPVPGTGKWDWKGLLPFEMNPKVYNPLSGYIANWNNSPQKDYPASDLFAGKPQQEVVLAALEDTWETLSKRYGNNVSNWKTPAMTLTFRANNFFGVPQAAVEETRHQAEYQNRGTENDMIVFSPTTSDRPVLAWDVVAPGQSGFIAPDGTVDKHYEDQLKMYENFGRKSLWLTKQDVEAHKESQEVLHVQR